MIIIDGRQSEMQVSNFTNLEEILVNVLENDSMEQRIITDVLVNEEQFSEIYPHQAEDIGSEFIQSVEVRSVPVGEMAVNISLEMYKVVQMMSAASKEIARLFRQADDAEGLELFQDLLDVTRDFMGMINVLRDNFTVDGSVNFEGNTNALSNLLSEMSEVLENEDWVLLADLLEYEFTPVCDGWTKVIQILRDDIKKVVHQ